MSWPVVKLGNAVESIMGQAPPGSECNKTGEGTIFVKAGEFGKEFPVIKEWTTKPLRYAKKGDTLLCVVGATCGKVNKAIDCAIGRSVAAIRPIKDKIDENYLFYFVSSWSSKLRNMSQGAAQTVINKDMIANLEIPLPPLDEQKRIAAILDKADAIRRKRQKAILLADDFLRSVFLDMFGDPVTNPKGWEVKKFSDLGNWASGGTPSRSVSGYFEGEINWFSARELNHRYLNESVEKITDAALSKSAAKIFPAGSMLVGMYDTAAFKISILNVASASNQACANIIPNEKIDIEWFFSFIEFSKETYLRQRRGVRQQNLNLGMIKDFDLPLPPKTEQEKFVKLAHKTMQMKERNYSSLSNSLDSFNSLSQKAFAGDL